MNDEPPGVPGVPMILAALGMVFGVGIVLWLLPGWLGALLAFCVIAGGAVLVGKSLERDDQEK